MSAAYAERLGVEEIGPHERWCDRYAGVRGGTKAVLCAIAWYVDRFGQNAHPSIAQLVERSGYCERTVHYAIARLVTRELIEVDREDGRGAANLYRLPLGSGAKLAPLRLVEAAETCTPNRPAERDPGAELAPQVVGSLVLESYPPYPPREPAMTPPSAAHCLAAKRRGRPCSRCHDCGTSPRQLRKAAQRAAELETARRRVAAAAANASVDPQPAPPPPEYLAAKAALAASATAKAQQGGGGSPPPESGGQP